MSNWGAPRPSVSRSLQGSAVAHLDPKYMNIHQKLRIEHWERERGKRAWGRGWEGGTCSRTARCNAAG